MTPTEDVGPTGAARKPVQPVYAALGERVRRARHRRSLIQAELADGAGVTRSSIANIEAGRQRVPLHVVEALAVALGYPMPVLVDDAAFAAEFPPCDTCHGAPPAGFACLACGTEATS